MISVLKQVHAVLRHGEDQGTSTKWRIFGLWEKDGRGPILNPRQMNILPMLATLGEKLVTGTAAVQSPADEMIIMLAQSCHVALMLIFIWWLGSIDCPRVSLSSIPLGLARKCWINQQEDWSKHQKAFVLDYPLVNEHCCGKWSIYRWFTY